MISQKWYEMIFDKLKQFLEEEGRRQKGLRDILPRQLTYVRLKSGLLQSTGSFRSSRP